MPARQFRAFLREADSGHLPFARGSVIAMINTGFAQDEATGASA
jgi:hypothetical protein